MTALPKEKLTAAEYLDIERKAPFKSEFFDGEIFAMAGGTGEHHRIKENLIIEIGSRLKGGPCQSFSSELRVLVDRTGLYTYPDIVIVCGGPEYTDATRDTLTNPRIVIEVLSDSTESYDRGTKFRHYQRIPTLQTYVLVAQNEPRIEQFVRQSDDVWNLQIFGDRAGNFTLAPLGITVPMVDIYSAVAFPPPEPLR